MKAVLSLPRMITVVLSAAGIILAPILLRSWGLYIGIVEVGLLVIFGFAVGPIAGSMLGKPAGSIYLGSNHHDKIPRTSEAESAFKRQEYGRAKELYLDLIQQFPTYLSLYQPTFELLVNRLHDSETARSVYRTGWKACSAEDRRKLERLYRSFVPAE